MEWCGKTLEGEDSVFPYSRGMCRKAFQPRAFPETAGSPNDTLVPQYCRWETLQQAPALLITCELMIRGFIR